MGRLTIMGRLAFLLGLIAAGPAAAQLGGPPVPPAGSIIFGTSISAAVSTSTAKAELPVSAASVSIAPFPFVNVTNDGTGTLFFVLCPTSTCTATTAGIPVPPAKTLSVFGNAATYIAFIGAAASEIRVTQSNGPAAPL